MHTTTLYTFNKYFADYVLTLKRMHPHLKTALSVYKVLDNPYTCTDYANEFQHRIVDASGVMDSLKTARPADEYDDSLQWLSANIFGSLSLSQVRKLTSVPEFCRAVSGTITLCILQKAHRLNLHSNANLHKILMAIGKVQTRSTSGASEALSQSGLELMDDDMSVLFERLDDWEAAGRKSSPSSDADDETSSFVQQFERTKIGQLASELVKDIRPEDLNLEDGKDPSEMFKLDNLLDPNSPMGGMIGKLGQKLQDKLSSGELQMGDMISEVMGMLQGEGMNAAIKNNPMLDQLLNAVKSRVDESGSSENDMMTSISNMFSRNQNRGDSGTENIDRLFEQLRQSVPSTNKSSGSQTADRMRKKLDERRKKKP